MPSIRDFRTVVEPRDSGGHRIFLQSPLTASADDTDVGWVTWVTFVSNPLDVGGRPFATLHRVTTPISHTPSGLRRRLKDRPYTTEKLTVYTTYVVAKTSTQWDWRRMSATTVTTR